jgi:predicted hydrocarbon binding protein
MDDASGHGRTDGTAGAPLGLRARLRWTADVGAIHDGPRRYLLMRPDVLMGMVRRLPAGVRAAAQEAFAASVRDHARDSVAAYLREVGDDPSALLEATAQAAADLGWGSWRFHAGPGRLVLEVAHSPFAEGHGLADAPVCGPIVGLLGAVAEVAVGADADVRELGCAACGAACCTFEARWATC